VANTYLKHFLSGLSVAAGVIVAGLLVVAIAFAGVGLHDYVLASSGGGIARYDSDYRVSDAQVELSNISREVDKPLPPHDGLCSPATSFWPASCSAPFPGDNGHTIITGKLSIKNISLQRQVVLQPSSLAFQWSNTRSSPRYDKQLPIFLKPGQGVTVGFTFDDSYSAQKARATFELNGRSLSFY
jgi:hypothetical protein